jgi:hypothetical protein
VVHITVSRGDDSTVSTEHWLFPPNRAVTIKGPTKTIYNARTGLVKDVDAAGNEIERVLDGDQKSTMQHQIRGLFDVWPLEMIQSAILTSEVHDGLDVYDLKWSEGNQTLLWRAYVDQATQRVQKVDRFFGNATMNLRKMHSFDLDYPTSEEAETFLERQNIKFN